MTTWKLAVLGCSLMAAALAPAHSQTFEWNDAGGTPRQIGELEPTSVVTALRVRQGADTMTPQERRTLEIVKEAARETRDALAPRAGSSESLGRSPGAPPAVAGEGTPASVQSADSPATENVRDPCLLSADPRCVEKHAADYDPLWGYAPSRLRGAMRDRGADALADHPPQAMRSERTFSNSPSLSSRSATR